MKLKEYIDELQEALNQFGNLDVIYSVDQEGNAYHELTSGGGCMYVENIDEYFLEDIAYEEIEDYEEPVKVFCIN